MRTLPRILVAAVAALVGLVSTPVVATAVSVPVVAWARSVEDDLGTLEVSVAAEAGVVDLQAHVISSATGEEVALVDDFLLHSGTAQNGVWRTPGPVQLSELGSYRVVVDVTDAVGTTASGPSNGSLSYFVRPAFSPLHLFPDTLTYTERSVQVSGTLTGKRPDTGQTVPLAEAEVYVGSSMAEEQPVQAMTDADGTFAATLVMTGPGEVFVDYMSEPGYLNADTARIQVPVSPAESAVTLTASATEVDAGQPITVSSQLTWRSPQGWQPLADSPISVVFCNDIECTGLEYPTTGPDGTYEVTLTAYESGTYVVTYPSPDPFIARASAQVDVTVWQPADFADFTAARESTDSVVVQGHMQFGRISPAQIPVQIQYRTTQSSTWTTLATAEAQIGYEFVATVTQKKKGYWRAYYAGIPDLIRSATSTPVFVP